MNSQSTYPTSRVAALTEHEAGGCFAAPAMSKLSSLGLLLWCRKTIGNRHSNRNGPGAIVSLRAEAWALAYKT